MYLAVICVCDLLSKNKAHLAFQKIMTHRISFDFVQIKVCSDWSSKLIGYSSKCMQYNIMLNVEMLLLCV